MCVYLRVYIYIYIYAYMFTCVTSYFLICYM